ncbi:hypothetical protein [Ruegeria sp. MALMAid1280]|uniref:hypothetical protein n=1 Tax=Ruegeria sp. MALMAid1280 TaxID=3411634 RepID=UPI003BA2FFF7
MKMVNKAINLIVFFLSLAAISTQVAHAANSSACAAYKDETYCSTYNVTGMLTSSIESDEETSADILVLINVAEKAEHEIRYYVTFNLILSLAGIEEGFDRTEEYRQLKRSLAHQMLRYVSLTGDEIRASIYLAYLDLVIEPEETLPRSVSYPQVDWAQQSEDSLRHIVCAVESDIPFLPFKEIVESTDFKSCMT